jgi:hypothetical protein
MILSEIRKAIDRNFKTESLMSAQRYSQGYIDGIKHAPKYGVLSDKDWHELNNYISEKLKEKLNYQKRGKDGKSTKGKRIYKYIK